jgi:thioredoxin 1
VSEPLELGEDSWDEVVLGASVPVLVDWWAPWCIPCRRVTPIVRELAADLGDRIVVGTLNADEAPRLAARYEVLSLPTLLLFVRGEPVARIVGVPKADRLRAVIESNLDAD